MIISKTVLREKLVKEKSYLKRFVEASGSKSKIAHLIHIASRHQLIVLVLVVHHVAAGEISISKECLAKVKRSKKGPALRNLFEHEKDVRELKKQDREALQGALSKIASILPDVVGALFDGSGSSRH
jgi:hypothetical protein